MTDVTMRIWRGDAERGRLRGLHARPEEGEVVLDVIHRIQGTRHRTSPCRWNCKAGKCGSCSRRDQRQAAPHVHDADDAVHDEEPITVTPMRTFPIISDLVTDVSFNYDDGDRRSRRSSRAPGTPTARYRMSQNDVDRGQEFRKCIECFLCQNVCHVIRDHEENKANFAGPRFFDPPRRARDAPARHHRPARCSSARSSASGYCNITKCCTEVCPEHIHITDNAIIPLKERVVDAAYDPVAWLGRKIRRTKRSAQDAAVQPAP